MPQEDVEALIAALVAKIESNRDIVGRSAYGRLTWRKSRNGGFEVDLEPKL